MNPIHLHQLARDHQAELLAEAARERLARSAHAGEAHRNRETVRRLRALLETAITRIGRTRQAPLPPRSA